MSKNYEFETEIDAGDIIPDKLEDFIKGMKYHGLLNDSNIQYNPGEEAWFEDFEITVEFSVSPGCRGVREKYGVQLEPDEPPCIEDLTAYVTTLNKDELIGAGLSKKKDSAKVDLYDYFKDMDDTFGEQCWEWARD